MGEVRRGVGLSVIRGGRNTGNIVALRNFADGPLPQDLDPEVRSELLGTIENAIIPQLLMAHRHVADQPACADTRLPPSSDEIARFATLCVEHDATAAMAFIEELCREGMTLEVVLLDLVATSAKLLGEQWKSDERSFAQVTAGLSTLQQVVHALSPSFAPDVPHRGLVVLTAAPGEQHVLGLYLVGEFLRRAGWGVEIDPACPEGELRVMVSTRKLESIGFTVSNTRLLEPLGRLITSLRKVSRNTAMGVMVGGALDLREFGSRFGCFVAKDARDTIDWLENRARRQG